MFRIIKLKNVLIALGLILISVMCSIGIVAVVENRTIPKPTYTIVVDAGHGGRDDGCSGVNGVKESQINLEIAKLLKSDLETLGINVVLTRCDGNGLYKSNVDNYKQSDMEARMEIINKASPDMVISIHQNAFNDRNQCGAQAFYQEQDEVSKGFADSVQSQLLSQLDNAKLESNKGDYYLLKESKLPAIIVECGFLSNENEEKLLSTTEYQNKVAYAIMCGVVKYFNLCGND